jgi:hypothetical protein
MACIQTHKFWREWTTTIMLTQRLFVTLSAPEQEMVKVQNPNSAKPLCFKHRYPVIWQHAKQLNCTSIHIQWWWLSNIMIGPSGLLLEKAQLYVYSHPVMVTVKYIDWSKWFAIREAQLYVYSHPVMVTVKYLDWFKWFAIREFWPFTIPISCVWVGFWRTINQ